MLRNLDELKRKIKRLDRFPAPRDKDFIDKRTRSKLERQQEWINIFEILTQATETTGAGLFRPWISEEPKPDSEYFGYDVVPLIAHHGFWQRAIQYLVDKVDLVVVNLAGLPETEEAVRAGLEFELKLVLAKKRGPRVAFLGSGYPPPPWLERRAEQWSPAEGDLETYLWHDTEHDHGTAPLAAHVMTTLCESYCSKKPINTSDPI